MRKYKYKGRIEEFKTLPTEITIEEFEKIVKSQDDSYGTFTHYLDTFEILGLSTDFVDDIDDETLYMLIKEFQEDFLIEGVEYQRTLEVDGYTYSAYDEGGEFKLKARDLARIEEKLGAKPDDWITYALAVIFKRDDLSGVEHKTNAHIKHKEKLFKSITMDIALPYIMFITNTYIKSINILSES